MSRKTADRHEPVESSDDQHQHQQHHAQRQRVPLAGGVAVYEPRGLGRELVGFEDVTDPAALADGLAARGHGRGAVYHLPELDGGED